MRVLWICNKRLNLISNILNECINPFGGWLESTCQLFISDRENELCVMYPDEKSVHRKHSNFEFHSFNERKCYEKFVEIINVYAPDIIHIWGTEFKHTMKAIDAIEYLGYLDKCVISIQGLVSIYGKYHFTEGLPFNVIYRFTLRDALKRENIFLLRRKYIEKGIYERKSISKCKYIIGRTDWDKAITSQINNTATYFFCNESLRDKFYEKKWSINNIKKHSIFVSQCNYPIKGFHYILMALPIILKKYPNTHVYTTGKDLNNLSHKERLFITSYQKYIITLIKHFGLEEHITFLGTLSEEDMCEQYLKANVFVSASTIENSPNSVGEAMLLGCPVISSDVGGIKNLLKHEEDGFIYQSTAPYMLAYYICRIFDEKDLAIKFSKNARNHAMVTHDRMQNYNSLMYIYNSIKKGINK